MNKNRNVIGTLTALLVSLPLVVQAGELDSIFGSIASLMIGAVVAVVTLVCFVRLLLISSQVEPSATSAAEPDNRSSTFSTLPTLSSSRLGHVVLLAAPCYAAWLYVEEYHYDEFAAGQYAAFYAAFFLPTLGIMALLWLTKRPSAAAGLGLSATLVLALLFGLTQKWNQDGKLWRYRHDEAVARQPYVDAQTSIPDSLSNGMYTYVEQMPTFEGGADSLQKAIRQQLRYPPQALAQQVEGNVVVGCVVTEEGNVAAVTLIRGIGYGCDEEAMRVVKELPFNPGRQGESAVRVYTTVEVPFELPPTVGSKF